MIVYKIMEEKFVMKYESEILDFLNTQRSKQSGYSIISPTAEVCRNRSMCGEILKVVTKLDAALRRSLKAY